MFLPGNVDAIAERQRLCGMRASPEGAREFTYEDPDKAFVMGCIARAVAEGLAEWDRMPNGDIWVRFISGEVFLLAGSSITRL